MICILLMIVLVLSSFIFVTISDDDINYDPIKTHSSSSNLKSNFALC